MSTEKPPPVREELIKIVNINAEQTAHLEKTANAASALAQVGIGLIVLVLIYGLYRVVIHYERMKTNNSIKNAVSLAQITTEK